MVSPTRQAQLQKDIYWSRQTNSKHVPLSAKFGREKNPLYASVNVQFRALFQTFKAIIINHCNSIFFLCIRYFRQFRGDGTGGAGGAIAPPAFTNLIQTYPKQHHQLFCSLVSQVQQPHQFFIPSVAPVKDSLSHIFNTIQLSRNIFSHSFKSQIVISSAQFDPY